METVEKFDPGVAALLIVDVQNDFCHPEGVMAQRGRDVSAAGAMIPRLASFVDAARRCRVPVIWIQTTHDDMTNSAVWLARRTTSLRATTPRRSNCYTGTWGAEFFKIGPEEGEPVVVKHRYSAFAGTELMWVLRSVDRQSLLITGVATETCVESTLRDGLFHDFHVNLVEDCCASYSREAHDASVRVVHRCFGLVASSDEIVAQWESLR